MFEQRKLDEANDVCGGASKRQGEEEEGEEEVMVVAAVVVKGEWSGDVRNRVEEEEGRVKE